jgi:peptidoglycan/LPS O-acetylase OafA/YrhL
MAPNPSEITPDAVQHFPELDGIRGLAILLVLTAHGANFLNVIPGSGQPGFDSWGRITMRVMLQGWGGVDLFFTLSGFLITGILLRARNKNNYFSSFYARRALRIFPIYYFVLIGTLLLMHFAGQYSFPMPKTRLEVISYFVYLPNWSVFWTGWAGLTNLLGVYWSLAVEEQFYLVWPTLIRFVNLRIMFNFCVAGFLAGWPIRFLILHHYGLALGVLHSPVSRLDGLFLGAAIALYRELRGNPLPLRWAVCLSTAGCILLAVIAFSWPSEFSGAGRHLWSAGVTAFALISGGLVAASHYRPRVLHSILTLRPLLVAGRLSYGMYVYHLLIFFWLGRHQPHFYRLLHVHRTILPAIVDYLFAVGLTTAVAAISFQWLETPFLKLKRHFPSPAAPV